MNPSVRICILIILLCWLQLYVLNGFCQTSSATGFIRPYLHLSPQEAGMIVYKLGCNYGIVDVLDVGIYLGTAVYTSNDPDLVPRDDFLFGMNIKYHLTNLYVTKKFSMLVLFLSGDIGGWKITIHEGFIPDILSSNGIYLDYGVYAGIVFYPIKNLGFIWEVGYGNNSIIRGGVLLRFQLSK